MNMFTSLKFFNYRIWFAGALVANVGTWMQRVAQDWYVFNELTDSSGVAVGVVTALQFAPTVVLTPLAGLLADRVNRRKLLMVCQGALGLLAAVLGVLILLDAVTLGHMYIFALALGVIAAFDAPARQAFVSELVPPENLANAVGLNSASFNAARLIGPAVAGLSIAAVGTGWVFVINAVSFAGTIGAMMLMRTDLLQRVTPASRDVGALGQLREGVDYVLRRTDIQVIMAVMLVTSSLGLNFQLTSTVMASEVFGKGAGEYGLLGSVLAIGSLAGALMAARRSRPRVRLVIGAAFAFGVTSGLMALAPTFELYAVAAVFVGFSSLTMITAANTVIQLSTEPNMRGRVMSLYLLVFLGSTPVGSPIVGWIAEEWGGRWSIGVGAIASVLVAVAAAWWAKSHWGVEVTYRLRQRPHLAVTHPQRQRLVAEVRSEAAVREAGSKSQ